MEYLLLAILAIAVIGFIYYVSKYNRFQKLVNQTKEASSGIDVALTKRYDLISNLLEVVKGYAKHEKEVFAEMAKARNQMMGRNEKNDQMNQMQTQLLAVAESYPEIKADKQFLNLQKNMTDVEEHLQAARRLYNRNATELNTAIDSFPTAAIAQKHNIEKYDLFSAEDDKRIKPEVNL